MSEARDLTWQINQLPNSSSLIKRMADKNVWAELYHFKSPPGFPALTWLCQIPGCAVCQKGSCQWMFGKDSQAYSYPPGVATVTGSGFR